MLLVCTQQQQQQQQQQLCPVCVWCTNVVWYYGYKHPIVSDIIWWLMYSCCVVSDMQLKCEMFSSCDVPVCHVMFQCVMWWTTVSCDKPVCHVTYQCHVMYHHAVVGELGSSDACHGMPSWSGAWLYVSCHVVPSCDIFLPLSADKQCLVSHQCWATLAQKVNRIVLSWKQTEIGLSVAYTYHLVYSC